MTKPLIDDTRWAVTVGGAESPNQSVPDGTLKDDGYPDDDVPLAKDWNYWHRKAHAWFQYLNGQTFEGPTSVVALLETDMSPLAQYKAYNGKTRSLVDHAGYRMGQVTELDEAWRRAGSVVIFASSASAAVSGNGTVIDPGEFFQNNSPSAGYWAAPGVVSGMTITQATMNLDNVAGSTVRGDLFDAGTTQASGVTVATATTTANGALALAGGSNLPWTVAPSHAVSCAIHVTAGGGVNVDSTGMLLTCVVDPVGWVWTPSSNGPSSCQRSYIDPTAGLNQRGLRVIGQGAGAATGIMTTEAFECFLSADCHYEQEWMLRTGTIADGTNRRKFSIGIQLNDGAGLRTVSIYNENTDASWSLREDDHLGGVVSTSTGVAIVANTTYRMRIEIIGSNASSAAGGSFRLRAFINGAKVVDVTSATVPSQAMRPIILAGATAAGGPYDFTVGRLRRVWNHLLTQDSL